MNGNPKFRGSSSSTTCGEADAFGSTAKDGARQFFRQVGILGLAALFAESRAGAKQSEIKMAFI